MTKKKVKKALKPKTVAITNLSDAPLVIKEFTTPERVVLQAPTPKVRIPADTVVKCMCCLSEIGYFTNDLMRGERIRLSHVELVVKPNAKIEGGKKPWRCPRCGERYLALNGEISTREGWL